MAGLCVSLIGSHCNRVSCLSVKKPLVLITAIVATYGCDSKPDVAMLEHELEKTRSQLAVMQEAQGSNSSCASEAVVRAELRRVTETLVRVKVERDQLRQELRALTR